MDAIRGTCPGCGDVKVDPSAAILEAPDEAADRHLLAFRCPRCHRPFRSAVDDTVVRALKRIGVPTRGRSPGHPENPPGGPTLGPDDLLDLHLLLASEGWFEQLVRLTGDNRVG